MPKGTYWKDAHRAEDLSKKFREDVVAVARQGQAMIAEVAEDSGISMSCLLNWLTKADVDDGRRPGPTTV